MTIEFQKRECKLSCKACLWMTFLWKRVLNFWSILHLGSKVGFFSWGWNKTVNWNRKINGWYREILQSCFEQFQEVFEKPTGLPPKRSCDHQIILKNDTQPISIRPYKYPFYQKIEIEKIAQELLKYGVIRPSQSPFSSPVLLVRKVYGSWRMCIKALNKKPSKKNS